MILLYSYVILERKFGNFGLKQDKYTMEPK